MNTPPTHCVMKIRVVFSVIGIIVGISVLPAFGLKFKNLEAGIWGAVSGLVAAISLFVHIQYMRDVWKTWAYQLKYYIYAGCFFQLAGVGGIIAYLVLAISLHMPFELYGQNYWLVIVWCFMTWKWGFVLFYFSRSYRDIYGDEYRLPSYEHI